MVPPWRTLGCAPKPCRFGLLDFRLGLLGPQAVSPGLKGNPKSHLSSFAFILHQGL